MKHYDAVIIGFGKGGKTLAGVLAGEGKKVALVEKSDKMYGGTCINIGCIPSKSFVRSSAMAALRPDIPFGEKAKFYAGAVDEKRKLTGMLRKKNYDKLKSSENVEIYDGFASFISPDEIRVESPSGSMDISGESIYINTGAVPALPPIPGLKDSPYCHTSEFMLDNDKLPRRLLIIGAGYIGLEFASIYSGFGSRVTILEGSDTLLPREDRDMASEIKKTLESKGVDFKMAVSVIKVENGTNEAEVHFKENGKELSVKADAVLVATSRRPNTDGLNLEKAGVELTERGAVKTDDSLKTTADNIWAMGDVTGGLQFTYVSLDDFRIIRSGLSAQQRKVSDRTNVPYSVFIDPPFSRVGITEKEARLAGFNIKVAKMPAGAIPKAQVLKKTQGLLKAVVNADTGKILGAALLCEESYEMINIVKLAIDMNADYTVLRDMIYTHPTMSEALNDLFSLL